MSEEKDLYTIIKEKLSGKESRANLQEPKPEEKPAIVEKAIPVSEPESVKTPKLPQARTPKHTRG